MVSIPITLVKASGRIRNQPELMSDTDPICYCSTSWFFNWYDCNKVDCTFSSPFINCACWPCSDFFINNIIFHSKNKIFWLWFHLVVPSFIKKWKVLYQFVSVSQQMPRRILPAAFWLLFRQLIVGAFYFDNYNLEKHSADSKLQLPSVSGYVTVYPHQITIFLKYYDEQSCESS